MLKKAQITWTAKQVAKMVRNNTITFDNVVQRGLVWDDERKSLLIHSLLYGYPVPPFFLVKKDGKYDCLDGQQRATTLESFMSDGFELIGCPELPVENEETGEVTMVDINGFVFSELPEEMQDTIKDSSFCFYYFDEEISSEEITNMFFRLNNGKALTAIELTRVKAKSMNEIIALGQHELLKNILTAKAFDKYTNEDIVIKTYAMLTMDEPCLATNVIRPMTQNAEFSAEEVALIDTIYTFMNKCVNLLREQGVKKVARRVSTRTHLISLAPIVKYAIEHGKTVEDVCSWFCDFFGGTKTTTSEEYNNACGGGSARKESVKARTDALWEDYKWFFDAEDVTEE